MQQKSNDEIHWVRTTNLMLVHLGIWLFFGFIIHMFVNVLNKVTIPILNFPLGFYEASVQGSVVSVGRRWASLRTLDRNELGQEPFYTVADFSFGLEKKSLHGTLYISNAFNKRAVLNRYTECNPGLCDSIAVYDVPNQPRTIGVKFGQKF